MARFSLHRYLFGRPSACKRPRPRPRLVVESLETRRVLSTLHVGAHEPFHTIQTAVIAAHAADTILVDPGTYQEQVTIAAADNGLSLLSLRPLAAIIKAPAAMTGTAATFSTLCIWFCANSTWIWKALPEFGSRQ